MMQGERRYIFALFLFLLIGEMGMYDSTVHATALLAEIEKFEKALFDFCSSDAVQHDYAMGGDNLMQIAEGEGDYFFGFDWDDEEAICTKVRNWIERMKENIKSEKTAEVADTLHKLNYGVDA